MELRTDRLVLREFREADLEPLTAIQSDARWLANYRWDVRDPNEVKRLVDLFIASQREEPRMTYQIAITLDRAFIGDVGIRIREPDATEADIGYEIAPDQWRRGYASEAARAIVAFGFEELKLHRVWSWCYDSNIGSAAVLRSVGMKEEGRQRETDYFKGRWHDTLIFGVLEDEWRSLVGTRR